MGLSSTFLNAGRGRDRSNGRAMVLLFAVKNYVFVCYTTQSLLHYSVMNFN